ncbi:hypothetical protein ACFL59_04125 [Planctomycetota bacterium]
MSYERTSADEGQFQVVTAPPTRRHPFLRAVAVAVAVAAVVPLWHRGSAWAKSGEVIEEATSDLKEKGGLLDFFKKYACNLSPNASELAGTALKPSNINKKVFNREELDFKSDKHPLLQFEQKKPLSAVVGEGGESFAYDGTLSSIASKDQPQVILLPWLENGCTFTQLDKDADLFLTGPLSGCHVYVASGKKGQPYVLHANSNSTGSDKKANILVKDKMAQNIIGWLNDPKGKKGGKGDIQLTHRLARGEYSGGAFVFGLRKKKDWKFYVTSFEIDKKKKKLVPKKPKRIPES